MGIFQDSCIDGKIERVQQQRHGIHRPKGLILPLLTDVLLSLPAGTCRLFCPVISCASIKPS